MATKLKAIPGTSTECTILLVTNLNFIDVIREVEPAAIVHVELWCLQGLFSNKEQGTVAFRADWLELQI